MEGVARFIAGVMKEEFTRDTMRKLGALAAKPALNALKGRLDPRAYNGASMVGLNGVVIKSHGGADRVSFANAVRVAVTEARNGVPAQISQLLSQLSVTSDQGVGDSASV
jgi:glycerol-3-phosphate acyltransferase PlsX